jgi:hypothetical protein
MAAGATYEPIATNTLGSNTSLITFSSISGSYTDLILVVNGGTVSINDIYFRVNGDTASNYSYTTLTGDGTTISSLRTSGSNLASADYYGSPNTIVGASMQTLQFMNYSNTTTYKTILVRANRSNSGLDAIVNLWRSTSAITSIELRCATNAGVNFLAGSTFTLYGIASA